MENRPETMQERFYKGLGALTATLSSKTKAFKRASSILAYEATRRRKEAMVRAEDEREAARREKLQEFLMKRREPGGSGHYSWWGIITNKIDKINEIHQF